MIHHRSHERLHEYWGSLCGTRSFPCESQIDPDAISDIWPSCFLVSIDDVTRRLGYRYSYLGDDLAEAYGYDGTDPDIVLRLLATQNSSMKGAFDKVVKQHIPIMEEAAFVNLKRLNIKYRSCMLPLGYSDREVSHIIGSMSWRVY